MTVGGFARVSMVASSTLDGAVAVMKARRPPLPTCLVRFGRIFIALACNLALPLASVHAQQSVVMGNNFGRIPAGQWTTEIAGYRNDAPMGTPKTSTACASPLDSARSAVVIGAAAAGVATCTSKVLNDRPGLFEYESTCNLGGQQQVTRSTMRRVDAKTITVDARSAFAGRDETVTKIKSTYQGACPASAKPAHVASPECAEMSANRTSLDDEMAQCGKAAPEDRADCVAQLEGAKRTVAMMEKLCK